MASEVYHKKFNCPVNLNYVLLISFSDIWNNERITLIPGSDVRSQFPHRKF